MKISCSHSDKELTSHCWGPSTFRKRTEYQVLRVSVTGALFLSFMYIWIWSRLFSIHQTPKRLSQYINQGGTGGAEVQTRSPVAVCSRLVLHGGKSKDSFGTSCLGFWIGGKSQIKLCLFRCLFSLLHRSSAELQTLKSIPVHPTALLASEQLLRSWTAHGHFNSQF